LKTFFGGLNKLIQEGLILGWAVELELSLMMWKGSERRLVTVAGAWVENGQNASIELILNNDFSAVYGEGVAGKAFKNNRYVLWLTRISHTPSVEA
jgi:hypothetical protein